MLIDTRSLDAGCESILLNKVKMAVVGGADDFQEEMSYEFANMKATSNTVDELAQGRLPEEMSRPNTTSRSGFMEAAGCGIQIITTADMALRMGLPIYGIVAYTQMAGDRIGRSVPAPGQGVLTAAREARESMASSTSLLDIAHRRTQFEAAVKRIHEEHTGLLRSVKHNPVDLERQLREIDTLTECQIRDAQSLWGMELRRQQPDMAPLRAALAVWGLGVEDIQVATLHGTSTPANDVNEASVINAQMKQLGRSRGNPLLCVSQKHLTGHPKGAAGAWMLNGGLQVLQSGLVPGNRNADNIDNRLRDYEHLVYPSTRVEMRRVKAFMLTSFGFGQKGGLALVIAPRYVFAAWTRETYDRYRGAVLLRQQKGDQALVSGMMHKSLFRAKGSSAWRKEDETTVFLDPLARVVPNSSGEYGFDRNLHPESSSSSSVLGL